MSEMNCTSKTGKRKGAEEKNKHRTNERRVKSRKVESNGKGNKAVLKSHRLSGKGDGGVERGLRAGRQVDRHLSHGDAW